VKNHLLLCCFLSLWNVVLLYSQNNTLPLKLSGAVMVRENNQLQPLEYATIRLLSVVDSSLVTGTTTDRWGRFQLNAKAQQSYILFVSSIAYKNHYQHVRMAGNDGHVQLDAIVLDDNSIWLNEALVMAQRTQMQVKADTIEYDAAAYKLRENAVVEDLLKRLPGISITDDGKILVNGKEVRKVMVDGKDFFRSNPNLSIKNIPAEIMEKLQIIEDKSELSKLTGIDDGEELIAINITMQKGKKRGWLTSANVGGGSEFDATEAQLLRYSTNLFAARLVEESQLGLVANGNNINGINVGSGASTSGNAKPGLNASLSGGINFSKGKDDKKAPWLINSDLSYGFNDNLLRRTSIRQYYLLDSVSYQTDTVQQFRRDDGMRFSAKIENRSLDKWVFSFSPSASVSRLTRNDIGYTLLQAGNVNRDSVNSNRFMRSSLTPTIEMRAVMTVVRNFEKKKRRLSLSVDARYTSSNGQGVTNAEYYYYRRKPETRLVLRDQQWETQMRTFNNRLQATFVEPIGKKNTLRFSYWIQSNDRQNIRNNYKPDALTGGYTVLDLPYSKSIDNNILSQQLGISYQGVSKKVLYTIGLDYNPSRIRSRSFIQNASVLGSDSIISYYPGLLSFNYAPNGYLMYNMGKGQNLRFDYRGRSEAPTVAQIDPSRDESNPTNIRMGNPNLLSRFRHWSRLRYNSNNKQKQESLSINIEGNYILNDIVNFTSYDDETGIKTTQPVNQSGAWNSNGMLMYSRPLGRGFQLNNYTQITMRNDIGFSSVKNSDSQKTIATTFSVKEELGLTYKWEWLYLSSKLNFQSGNTHYSVESMLPQKTSSVGGFLNAQFVLPKAWVLSTELNHRSISGFSSQYNQSETLWNIDVSKNFMKNKAATVTLLLSDILRQQLSVQQIVTSNYVEDQQFNTLKSFVMLVFSYKFTSMK
jgi:hypothetical protein